MLSLHPHAEDLPFPEPQWNEYEWRSDDDLTKAKTDPKNKNNTVQHFKPARLIDQRTGSVPEAWVALKSYETTDGTGVKSVDRPDPGKLFAVLGSKVNQDKGTTKNFITVGLDSKAGSIFQATVKGDEYIADGPDGNDSGEFLKEAIKDFIREKTTTLKQCEKLVPYLNGDGEFGADIYNSPPVVQNQNPFPSQRLVKNHVQNKNKLCAGDTLNKKRNTYSNNNSLLGSITSLLSPGSHIPLVHYFHKTLNINFSNQAKAHLTQTADESYCHNIEVDFTKYDVLCMKFDADKNIRLPYSVIKWGSACPSGTFPVNMSDADAFSENIKPLSMVFVNTWQRRVHPGAKFLIPLMRMFDPPKTTNTVDGTDRFNFDGGVAFCGADYHTNLTGHPKNTVGFPKEPRAVDGDCCKADQCHIVQSVCCECKNDTSALTYTSATIGSGSYASSGTITFPSSTYVTVSGSVGSDAKGCTKTNYSFKNWTTHTRGTDIGCGVTDTCPCCYKKAPCAARQTTSSASTSYSGSVWGCTKRKKTKVTYSCKKCTGKGKKRKCVWETCTKYTYPCVTYGCVGVGTGNLLRLTAYSYFWSCGPESARGGKKRYGGPSSFDSKIHWPKDDKCDTNKGHEGSGPLIKKGANKECSDNICCRNGTDKSGLTDICSNY